MSWTPGRWPVSQNDTFKASDYANELRSELHARWGVVLIADPFAEGNNSWQVIRDLRSAVEATISGDSGSASFVDITTGKRLAIGTLGFIEADELNVFNFVFGGSRQCWINVPPSTEASVGAPDYGQPKRGETCHIIYLNELHDIIDALVWRSALESVGNSLNKQSSQVIRATKQLAIDAAWASFAGASPGSGGTNRIGQTVQYNYSSGYGAYNVPYILEQRQGVGFLLPATVQEAKICLRRCWNRFWIGSYSATATPWYFMAYVGTATLGTTWDYGSLGAAVEVPNTMYDDTQFIFEIAALSNYTADAVNYIQFRATSESPQWIVDYGDWTTDVFRYSERYSSPDMVRFHILYRLV